MNDTHRDTTAAARRLGHADQPATRMHDLDRQRYEIHAAVFAALANPTRHEMMHVLCDGPRTPSELAEVLEVTRPNVSQHLAVLQREGLVQRTRADGRVLWDVVDRRLGEACALFDEIVGRQLTTKAHALEAVSSDTATAAHDAG